MSMRILVCGGRDYADQAAVFVALDALHSKVGISDIIQGGARGADALAAAWAALMQVNMIEFKADWNTYSGAAGGIRNQRMLDEGKPHGVVAFPGGTGTRDMIRRSKAAGLTVWQPMIATLRQ